MSRGQRLALLALAGVVAVVAVALIRPDGGDERADPHQTGAPPSGTPRASGEAEPRPAPARTEATTIRIRDGRPVGGAAEITAKSGETVRLAFESNRADQLHIHGYDRYVELQPGRRARVSFRARLEGVFEIESHGTEAEIASLKVTP